MFFAGAGPPTTAPAAAAAADTSQQQQHPPCLWGSVRYGANVEDEWFVTWLLLELTRQLSGACVQLWDDDGDFLLIEVRQGKLL